MRYLCEQNIKPMLKSPRMSKKRFFKIYEEFKSSDLTVHAFC